MPFIFLVLISSISLVGAGLFIPVEQRGKTVESLEFRCLRWQSFPSEPVPHRECILAGCALIRRACPNKEFAVCDAQIVRIVDSNECLDSVDGEME